MFNPTKVDEVCVQATHLEARGKNVSEETSEKSFNFGEKGKWKFKGKDKKNDAVKKEEENITRKHCSKEGHDEGHCWKLHPEMRPNKFNNKDKEKIDATTQQDLESDPRNETKTIAMGLKGKDSIASTNYLNEPISNEQKRIELFHIRVIIKHTKVETLFDSGSQAHLISKSLVKKLGLETKPHLSPYPLGWVSDKEKLQVTKQCRAKFVIAYKLVDEVELDVVPLDIYRIILGSLYLYRRKAVFC